MIRDKTALWPIYDLWKNSNNSKLDWITESGGRLNIKMLSYQYRDPHVEDKTVSRPSYDRLIFNMSNPIPGKDGLYIATGPWYTAYIGFQYWYTYVCPLYP